MPSELQPLTLDTLSKAVSGTAAAIRLRVRLQPAGGPGTKVFPPTYAGGVYATEKRLIDGEPVDCVLLDSVQSQANRLEQALLQAYRDDKLKFPLIAVQFPFELPDVGEITTLDAPHRVFDAILRDSTTLKGVPFRPQVRARTSAEPVSEEGTKIATANVRNATPLFELCPTALVFGAWDSTGAAGGLGNKFARAVVSEIIGVKAVYGTRTGSRIDPLGIEKGEIYEGPDGSYVVLADEAKKDTGGKPVLFKRKLADKGKPSEINHSNVTPDYARYDWPGQEQTINVPDPLRPGEIVRKGNIKVGGVTISYAEQTTVLSLAALRRLRFPAAVGKSSRPEADLAARTVLAALALAAVAHQMDPPDYFLRSNCQLIVEGEPQYEMVVTANKADPFALSAEQADDLFANAVAAAKKADLSWREEKITLQPKKALVDLVKRSRELGGED